MAEHGGMVQRGAGRETWATLESDPMSRCMPQLVLVPHADLPTVLHSRPKKVQVDAVFEHGLLGRLIEGPQPLGRAGGRAAAHSGAKRRTDQCEVPANATRVWLFADETTLSQGVLTVIMIKRFSDRDLRPLHMRSKVTKWCTRSSCCHH